MGLKEDDQKQELKYWGSASGNEEKGDSSKRLTEEEARKRKDENCHQGDTTRKVCVNLKRRHCQDKAF